MQVADPRSGDMTQFWINDIAVLRPVKDEASSSVLDPRLLPRECREGVRPHSFSGWMRPVGWAQLLNIKYLACREQHTGRL